MSDLDDIKAQLDAAKARRAKAALSEEESERAKLLAEIAETQDAARADEKARRELEGRQREAEAKKKAAGKYLVRYFDLGALLPDADPESLPGEGVLVVRSPPTHPVDALGAFYREVEAHERPLPDIYTDLVCDSVVYPEFSAAGSGESFRAFFEGSMGHGTVISVGDTITDLGGVRGKKTKRGRG